MSNPNLARKSATSTIPGESSFNDISAAIGGGGGGGGTGKNYITTGSSFNSASTAGWSLTKAALDSTTKVPNAAPSGSATGLSIGTVGGGLQLSVSGYSLSLVSTGSTLAGDMLLSDAITLDQEAQASVQTFSFFYKVASGSGNFSGTSSNTLAVAIYDATNLAWIQPAGAFNLAQSSGVGKASGTFQVPSNCTSVKLAVYFPNNTSGAITVYLDDFILGPQVVQYGAPVTDWQTYSPTVTPSTNTSQVTGLWRRIGDSIEVQGRVAFTGTGGAGAFRFNVPSFITIDTTKLAAPGLATNVGAGTYLNASDSLYPITAAYDTSYPNSVVFTLFGQGVPPSGYGAFFNANAATNGDYLTFNAILPVSGFSSSVQMSNDTDTRVVAASYSGATTIMGASPTTIIFPTAITDTHSGYNTSTGIYTVPVSGQYRVSAYVGTGGTTGTGAAALFVSQTGSSTILRTISRSAKLSAASASKAMSGSALFSCIAGDTLKIQASDADLNAVANEASFSIERLSGPSVIAASESVNFGTTPQTPTGVLGGGWQDTLFATKAFDTHNAYNTSNGTYTVPVSGKYIVTANIEISRTGGSYSLVGVWVNGAIRGSSGVVNVAGSNVASCSVVVSCKAGDAIKLRMDVDGTSPIYGTSYVTSTLFISRIGN